MSYVFVKVNTNKKSSQADICQLSAVNELGETFDRKVLPANLVEGGAANYHGMILGTDGRLHELVPNAVECSVPSSAFREAPLGWISAPDGFHYKCHRELEAVPVGTKTIPKLSFFCYQQLLSLTQDQIRNFKRIH